MILIFLFQGGSFKEAVSLLFAFQPPKFSPAGLCAGPGAPVVALPRQGGSGEAGLESVRLVWHQAKALQDLYPAGCLAALTSCNST